MRFPSGIELLSAAAPAGSQLRLEEPRLLALSDRVLPAAGFQGPGKPEVLTVRAFAHGRDGVALGPGAEVLIDIPALQSLGMVVDDGDGSYRAQFATDSPPGAYRVEVAFGDFVPLIRPVVHLTGGVDAARSEIRISAEAVRASSGDAVTWSVVPRDANGVALGAGHGGELGLPGVFASVPLEDAGDGSYRLAVWAWPVAGVFAAQVTVDGVLLEAQVPIEVAGPVDAERTGLEPKPIRQHEVAEPHVTKLAVEPRDAAGRRLGSGAEVQVVPRAVGLRASGAGGAPREVGARLARAPQGCSRRALRGWSGARVRAHSRAVRAGPSFRSSRAWTMVRPRTADTCSRSSFPRWCSRGRRASKWRSGSTGSCSPSVRFRWGSSGSAGLSGAGEWSAGRRLTRGREIVRSRKP